MRGLFPPRLYYGADPHCLAGEFAVRFVGITHNILLLTWVGLGPQLNPYIWQGFWDGSEVSLTWIHRREAFPSGEALPRTCVYISISVMFLKPVKPVTLTLTPPGQYTVIHCNPNCSLVQHLYHTFHLLDWLRAGWEHSIDCVGTPQGLS